MENLVLSFKVVLPIFLQLLLGYILRCVNIFDENMIKKLNTAVFKVFLPILIFYNVYTSEISDVFNPKLIAYSITAVLFVFLLCVLCVPVLEKDNKKRGVLIQGIFRSNFVILGMPLTVALCSEDITGTIAVLVAIIVPLFNLLAVISLEMYKKGKPNIKNIIKGTITNPLIISSAIGLVFLFSKIKFPVVIEDTVRDVSKMATPLSLVALGGAMNFKTVRGNIKPIFIGVFGKLVFTPLIIIPCAIFLGFRNAELAMLLSLSASPVAVSSYTMAQQMEADDELAAQLQIIGTTVCIITVFLWIYVLKQIGVL